MNSLKIMLNHLYRMQRKIEDINDNIKALQTLLYPKTQIISDMPKGGKQPNNDAEIYVEKMEYWKAERNRIDKKILDLKRDIETELENINATVDEITLVDCRYNRGMTWKETAAAIGWTLGKCYATYNKMIKRSVQKNQKIY